MLQSLNNLARLSSTEWLNLLMAVGCLPIFDLAIRIIGFRRCLAWIELRKTRVTPSLSFEQCSSLARMIHWAGRYHLWPARCLPQSLLLHSCLLRSGQPSKFCLGITKVDNGVCLAHAWVELNGVALDEYSPAGFLRAAFERPNAAFPPDSPQNADGNIFHADDIEV